MTNLRPGKEITCIKLHSGLISNYLEYAAAFRFIYSNIYLFIFIKDIVMIVAATENKLIIFFIYSFTYGMGCVEIKWSSGYRTDLSGRDHDRIDRSESCCFKCCLLYTSDAADEED